MKQEKTILVVGGGFGGLNTAIQLGRAFEKDRNINVVLVDKNDYHLYYPNLYEAATAEEEFVSIDQLKRGVSFPFSEVLPKSVHFVHGELKSIDQSQKVAVINDKEIRYDFAVMALGSMSDDFGIPGVREFGNALKTVADAVKIRNAAEFAIQSHRLDVQKKTIRFVIGGGGFTGVEFTGELLKLIDIICWKNSYPREKIELFILEGAHQLLPGLPEHVSKKVAERLRERGVIIHFDSVITEVTKDQIKIKGGEVLNYDVLIWTAGVKSAALPFVQKVQTDRKGRVIVNDRFQVADAEGLFAIGDNAAFLNANGMPLPQTAQQAVAESDYVVQAIAAAVNGKQAQPFHPKPLGFIVPVFGKWAALWLPGGTTWYGFISWLMHGGAAVRYFKRFMPLSKAISKVWFEERIFTRND
jgi:NADH:ubiquinone reductase (H+-translocating)